MKLLTGASNVYQIMDRGLHTVTKHFNDGKTQSAINTKKLKRLNHMTDQLYEVKQVQPEIEQREPMIVGSFTLKYAKMKILDLYNEFLTKIVTLPLIKELKWTSTIYT